MRRASRPFGLYRRPDSLVWWCRVPNGERASTKKADYHEALKEAARLNEPGADRSAHQAAYTFRDAIDRFKVVKRAAGRSDGTFDMYNKKVRHLARFVAETSDVNTWSATIVDSMIAKRRAEGASANTIARELTVLGGVLKQAYREDKFRAPIDKVLPIAFDPEYVPRNTFLSPEQLDRVLEQLSPNRAAAVAFMIVGAARRSDVFRSEVGDLTAEPGFVRVRSTKTKKNRSGVRLVPITPLTAKLLEQIKRATKSRNRLCFDSWSNVVRDLASACERASACRDHQRRDRRCPRCAKVQPIPRVTPNDLRRTAGKWLRSHGVEHGLIGDVLGHVDGRMAKLVYAQTEPADLRRLLIGRIGAVTNNVTKEVRQPRQARR